MAAEISDLLSIFVLFVAVMSLSVAFSLLMGKVHVLFLFSFIKLRIEAFSPTRRRAKEQCYCYYTSSLHAYYSFYFNFFRAFCPFRNGERCARDKLLITLNGSEPATAFK